MEKTMSMVECFDVIHYGKIVNNYEVDVGGNFIRQKAYEYANRIYLHTMVNGNTVCFEKLGGDEI